MRRLCLLTLVFLFSAFVVQAQEDAPGSVSIPGSFNAAVGCEGDWLPDCAAIDLTEQEDGTWTGTFTLPAGSYEYKVAIDDAWDVNYGVDGALDGDNITLELAEETAVTFTYDPATNVISNDAPDETTTEATEEAPEEEMVSEERPTENPDGFPMPESVSLPGSLGAAIGCESDWEPACEVTQLTDLGDGIWEGTFFIPAGAYLYKIALNNTWDVNYGQEGVVGGADIPIDVPVDQDVTFRYDHFTGLVVDSINNPGVEPTMIEMDIPDMVNIPGMFQDELGCPGEWQPDCEATALNYDENANIFSATYEIPAGDYMYKVAIDGGWGENYGAFGDADGADIALNLAEAQDVTFFYSHETNWIADNVRHLIVTAPGSYQDEIGCESDFDAACMASWLQDVEADGVYQFTTNDIPPGDYEVVAALGQSMDDTYGVDGEAGGDNIPFTVENAGTPVTFIFDTNINAMAVSVGGSGVSGANLAAQRAYWVTEDTLAWDVEARDDRRYELAYSMNADMRSTLFGLQGEFETLELSVNPDGLPASVTDKFPHLAGLTALTLSEDDLDNVPDVLKAQIAVGVYDMNGNLLDITALQIPGVLDDLYTYDGDLGATFDEDGVPTLTVWAPTAQNVNLHLFPDSDAQTESTVYPMDYDAENGTWSVTGELAWYGQYYLYEVQVFAPSTNEIVTNMVTDPYSVSLSQNSQRSQIIDLNDSQFIPDGWLELEKPALDAPEDITVYELHMRDFSAFDPLVPEELRGTYGAFTLEDTHGLNHLQGLADAGLTHLHLLPTFDIATINENRARWFEPDYDELGQMPPDSEEQQAAIDPIRDLDGFNWGYDPYHYNVPEGSYATDPDGPARILEYRQMVQAVNDMGMRFVQDVVYNHTNAAGQAQRSVLDRLVPGYYHRQNNRGDVFTSTCCPNTATEHNMMRRLMIDSVILHATQYKIDGFRFDLMGHHMVEDMIAVREALDALTLEDDGVDGSTIYIYGEGWNFGEVADDARGVNATQLNLIGTGIGTFNDRLRDAVRGGSPVDAGRYRQQGLGNGMYTNPTENHETNASLETWLEFADLVRVSLAGNLREFTITDFTGEETLGEDVAYGGVPPQPAGYTADPQENVVYVSKHDDQTLFDQIALKAPQDTPMADRVRYQNLSLGFAMYTQGVPFFHAGSEMLRSKSLDNDSYNSGDWFNRLDYTYQFNNFGVGLPPAGAGGNGGNWDIMQPLLADTRIQAGEDAIMANVMAFQDMLNVRYSTPLFRLRSAEDVIQRVAFHNTGADQTPGLIVMSISDMGEGMTDLDPDHAMVFVVYNTTLDEMDFTPAADLSGLDVVLHPVLAEGSDDVLQSASFDSETGTFTVPRLSAAVFVLPQS